MSKSVKCKQCDWRARSWEKIREEVWDVPDHQCSCDNPTGLSEERVPVYRIKMVCENCGATKYVEKVCYNEEEKPKKGQELRNTVDVR
jgi:hypothetical protein